MDTAFSPTSESIESYETQLGFDRLPIDENVHVFYSNNGKLYFRVNGKSTEISLDKALTELRATNEAQKPLAHEKAEKGDFIERRRMINRFELIKAIRREFNLK